MLSVSLFNQHFRIITFFVALIQSAQPCVIRFIPREGKNNGRGDYGFRPFESKRNKSLDCTCGTLPPPSNPPSDFDFPWEVLITHTGIGKTCRGTIINNLIILTTASCISKKTIAELMDDPSKSILFPQECYAQPNEIKIWITYGGITGKTGLEVSEIYTNPLFFFGRSLLNKVDYDIALVTLKSPLQFGNEIIPVCLPRSPDVGDQDLEGLDTELTRWYTTDPKNFLFLTESHPNFHSFIFPRMRCRMNTENNWVSDRFLCTLAPSLTAKQFIELGAAILVKNNNQYTQVGIHSWRTHFPLLYSKHSVSLASNVIGYLEKIETYSASKNAQWCKNDWSGLPKKDANYRSTEVNEPIERGEDPFKKTTSELRNVRTYCKCGLVNSLTSKGRIQGGVDTLPYEYGWQVLIVAAFDKNYKQLCGGAVINNLLILTAAHCVYKGSGLDKGELRLVDPDDLKVYVHRYKGAGERDDMSRLVKVEVVIPHPEFKVTGVIENDIALIVLRRRICFKCLKARISPLCLPETKEHIDLDDRDDAKIIGWGRTDVLEKKSLATTLQELGAKIISRQACIDILVHNPIRPFVDQVRYDDKKLCAGNFRPAWNYSDPAQGDSGGPLFLPLTRGNHTMIHVGIASMITMGPIALEHKDPKTVTLYTKTQSYLDFLDYYSLVVDAIWCSR